MNPDPPFKTLICWIRIRPKMYRIHNPESLSIATISIVWSFSLLLQFFWPILQSSIFFFLFQRFFWNIHVLIVIIFPQLMNRLQLIHPNLPSHFRPFRVFEYCFPVLRYDDQLDFRYSDLLSSDIMSSWISGTGSAFLSSDIMISWISGIVISCPQIWWSAGF